jgi:hypothetical protein
VIPIPKYRQRQRAFAEGAGGPAPPRRSPVAEGEPSAARTISSVIKDRRAARSKASTRTRPKSGHWSAEAIKRRYEHKG